MTRRVCIAYNFNDRDWFGGRNYFASLLQALESVQKDEVQVVLVTGERIETNLPDQFPSLEVHRTPLMDRLRPAWLARQVSLRGWDADPLLARYLRSLGVDLLSHSGQLGPSPGLRTAAWLYDFQFMHLPEYWEKKHIAWARQRYESACRNCDALIVSSHNALGDLERFAPWCRLPRFVLQFVSNPVDFRRIEPFEALCARYSLPQRYFHLPNQFWANKNHRLAIDALKILRGRGVQATIVCTGHTHDGRKPGYFPELMAHRDASGVQDAFRVLGVVPYRDTQALMWHSHAVINPSFFEGWSTTVEEAKTMRKVLLLSDIAVHVEQAAGIGRFFPPRDAGALADLMERRLVEEPTEVSTEVLEASYLARLRSFGETYLGVIRALPARAA